MKKSFPIMAALAALCLSACSALFGGNASISFDLSAWTAETSRGPVDAAVIPVLESVTITVSGPGMAPVSETFAPDASELTISVPAGPSRTISLSAPVVPGDTSPIARRTAETTVDLVPGVNKVSLTSSFETKMIVPCRGSSIIWQFDDMSGAAPLTVPGAVYPYDLDFDQFGRMYVGTSGAAGQSILCYKGITDNAPDPLQLDSGFGSTNTYAIAIDRKTGILYHASYHATPAPAASGLFSLSISAIETGTDTPITLPASIVINNWATYGLAVDDDGILYLLTNNSSGTPCLFKLDPKLPSGSMILASQTTSTLLGAFASPPTFPSTPTAYDVIVKGDRVYVSACQSFGSGDNSGVILELSRDLDVLRSYGYGVVPLNSDSTTPIIPRPTKFVAITNKKFYVTDDFTGTSDDRLVSFDDFDDPTLEVLRPAAPFSFFFTC